MNLDDLNVVSYAESPGGQYVVMELAEPVRLTCDDPGCRTKHLANAVLLDRTLNALVPFTTAQAAQEYVAELLGLTPGWG
jgi:hypothetical protein